MVALGSQAHNRQEMINPAWKQVEDALRKLADRTFVRVELSNDDQCCAMTVWGQGTAFFIAISLKESLYHYYWNGQAANGTLREIAGHMFDSEKVCEDMETVIAIAKEFWLTGRRLESVKWLSERIES
jgi:hypothetical protein